jgi:DNA-binding Lrp family transcriptional regulator
MTSIELDDVDFELLTRLDREGELDVDAVAAELEVSASTVYYRLDRYRDHGILRGTVADLDPEALGLDLTAITVIETSYDESHDEIAAELADLSGVQAVHAMFGEQSFVVFSRAADHEHLQRIAENIIAVDGVEDSTTNIVLRTYKDESRLLVNYDDADLESIFTPD